MPSSYLLFVGLAILAGAALPIQAAVNAKLGSSLKDPMYATLVTFIIGAIGVLTYLLATRTDFGSIRQASGLHWSVWTGGLLGAFYVAMLIVLLPRLGTAVTFGLVVAGQMVLSLAFDHFGWFDLPIQKVNLGKVIGVLLIIGGVWLLQR